jgi:hypothetical protein
MRIILLTLALLAPLAVNAQSPASPLKKVAIISLIGDQLSVDVYRRRVGTSLDTNAREVVALQDPVFDHTALFAAADTGAKLLPNVTFLPLAVPKTGSSLDPNLLLLDKAKPIPGTTADALQKLGFDHLLAVTKHSARTQMRFAYGEQGSGQLRGLGFYVDNTLWTRAETTGTYAPGYIAPYAYLKLTLVDLSTASVVREETVTVSSPRSATQNKDATGAWDALNPKEKADMLIGLIQGGISVALPRLLQAP